MNKLLFFTLLLIGGCTTHNPPEEPMNSVEVDNQTNDNQIATTNGVAIVIHGGAGAIKKENMPDSLESVYLSFLDSVVSHGYELLEQG